MKYKKIIFVALAILISLSVFWMPEGTKLFAKMSWISFVAVMMVRPLFELLRVTKVGGLFLSLMGWRRELGILAGVFGLAHGAGVLLLYGRPLTDAFTVELWDFRNLWGWGLLAMALMLPALVTSNVWSMRVLKKWWKPLQRLSYIAFVATGIHIFMVHYDPQPLVLVGIWAVLWIAAWWKKRK